ncbi:MAG: tetratricopeptide repeat protein [Paramuribaculum sp.]|nr:tetratricopeptide repeat protein [Paramuribaculum sp.]
MFLRILIFMLSVVAILPRAEAQINTDQVMRVGRNALYFEDYMLSIQYFNQVIAAKPYMAQPYFYRALAKFNLEDFKGAEEDATLALERNPFLIDAYELRGVARQNMADPEGAISDYNSVLATLPESRGVLFNKALAQEEMKDWQGASSTFDTLLDIHPGFDGGYLGRAKLYMAQGDTASAVADIDHALRINKNAVNGYVMRADIAINSNGDFARALEDMNEAIKLQPRYAGYFINRAFLRHRLDDYFGAMSDYDYAIQLDPYNYVAYYNRALLRAEVHDYDNAVSDLNQVLGLRGIDYRTLFNRAVINNEKHAYKEALDDINAVLKVYPELAAAYFLRFDIKRNMGDTTAQADYDRSMALAGKQKKKPQGKSQKSQSADSKDEHSSGSISAGVEDTTDYDPFALEDNEGDEPQDMVASRFSQLLTISDNSQVDKEYNNKSVRGRVQDRNIAVEIEPMFTLSYYNSPTELKMSADYLREADELNRSRILRFLLQVTNHEPALTDTEEIGRHFESIEYYNSYLATHTPRAIDYFGRAMDLVTVRNYPAAIEDLNRAIELSPDFTLAYFMRAMARYKALQSADMDVAQRMDMRERHARLMEVMADMDSVIKQSPQMAIAHYNKGVLLAELHDYTSALSAFDKAIELQPTFGEAYYDRGYVYFRLGNRSAGSADLSKAGELGVVASYNLLKRMNQ